MLIKVARRGNKSSEESGCEHCGERPGSDAAMGGAGPHLSSKPRTQTKGDPAERPLLPLASCNLH